MNCRNLNKETNYCFKCISLYNNGHSRTLSTERLHEADETKNNTDDVTYSYYTQNNALAPSSPEPNSECDFSKEGS